MPIIPEYLIASDVTEKEHELFSENETQWLSDIDVTGLDFNVSLQEVPDNLTESYKESLIERALQLPVRAISENSKVGWLLASKALLQLLVNPVIGILSYRWTFLFHWLHRYVRGVIIKFESFLHMFFIYEYISIIFCHNKQ